MLAGGDPHDYKSSLQKTAAIAAATAADACVHNTSGFDPGVANTTEKMEAATACLNDAKDAFEQAGGDHFLAYWKRDAAR